MKIFTAITLALLVGCLCGCKDSLPPGVDEKNEVTKMSPQDRIAAIQSNPNLSEAEKTRRIEFIKQKNKMQ